METVATRILDHDKTHLEEIAAALDRPLSWVLRKMIEYGLDQYNKGELKL